MNLDKKEQPLLFNDQFFDEFIQYLPELTEIKAQRQVAPVIDFFLYYLPDFTEAAKKQESAGTSNIQAPEVEKKQPRS
ncbi:hypothetical protein OIN60_09970 [Paenibacillus sp. P96]|uniref:Uncharacterized protein n=1 Tax=Paenibacillus zeirhizosphaerae TaxID=2987519 RepID=A0ABT9FQT8_9BACL|nr:hypothetical protein [Paenibacillus sp. P96]MDP4097095.1 hypothetical protein [Paenibacillus sp. P96]